MKKSLFFLVLLVLLGHHTFSQVAASDSVQAYVRAALDSMKRKSLQRDKVEWAKLYTQTLEKAKGAKTIRETYPVIEKALMALKDHHSKFAVPELIKAYETGYRSLGQKVPFPSGGMVAGEYAYLKVPDFGVTNLQEKREYADSIQSLIRHLDQQNPNGWILDLRRNWGGMLDPMMAGVAPLLGDGQWLGFEFADKKVRYWEIRNGEVLEEDSVLLAVTSPGYVIQNSKAPVCILTDRNTASSGEMLAMAFVGRPYTKLIGTNTGGLTTSNDLVLLPDGAGLILTTSVTLDRTGKRYGGHMEPDVQLKNLTGITAIDDYVYLQAAIHYLKHPKK